MYETRLRSTASVSYIEQQFPHHDGLDISDESGTIQFVPNQYCFQLGRAMLRITKEADYGIMLLAHFAAHPRGVIHTARETAKSIGLPLPMVSKILRSLARGNVLASHRGASGGYSLVRSPAELSVAEVIRSIEGPISLVQCGSEPGLCEQEQDCPTRVSWTRISQEVEKALERVPISELVGSGGDAFLRIASKELDAADPAVDPA